MPLDDNQSRAVTTVASTGPTAEVRQQQVETHYRYAIFDTLTSMVHRTNTVTFTSSSNLPRTSHKNTSPESVRKFRRLADEWYNATFFKSSSTEILSQPSYLKIIGMGQAAVPLILKEMQVNHEHWFLALASITEQDPVAPEDYGNIKKMTETWIQWGKQNGYL